MSLKSIGCSTVIVISMLLVGCGEKGPKRNGVKGLVKYKNEPIKAGSINFRSEGDGKHVGSAEIKDGKYEIIQQVGLPAGKYNVAVSYPDSKIPPPKADEAPGVAPLSRELLPKKYNESSTLTAEVKDGENQIDYDLK